ncbi:type 1 glutamine amidotransferase [Sphingomonas sp. BGYR3]|uniref:type 1 glutamine amidotransferase domain-containing protein n=1 Tax=Sphingomonas sp. BGYR3 TaxID=2975483 RepID=UPI0021A7D416|nr:type 1 glutamine amidotransferase domain-containing protein [Sphingomonas sp. BGYR3]MDG5489810.1 type 1 glutamine amidotransferase [Sphingomonas sp. BGYR3]
MAELDGVKVLMLATDGFEQSELFDPRQALIDAGAQVILASLKRDAIRGVIHDQPGDREITPDLTLDEVEEGDYDALLLPGGLANPDALRINDRAVEIVGAFCDDGKTVAAICHAPWLLVEADVVDGRTVTSWPSVRTDLANAGANVVDREVVVDENLITSRKPDDIPAFNKALIQALADQMADAD